MATVLASGLQGFCAARVYLPVVKAIEVSNRGARVARNLVHEQLRAGMSTLGTIATTAPLIGFCGTIVGMTGVFRGYIGNRTCYLVYLVHTLAEALVCSALGILVAIPAVWCFNSMRERLLTFDSEMEIASRELMKYLEIENQPRAAQRFTQLPEKCAPDLQSVSV